MNTSNPQNSADQGGRILVIEPEQELAARIGAALNQAAPGARADLARNIEEAQGLVVSNRPDLFVLDVDAIPDLSKDFLFDLRTSHPRARAIVLTGAHMAGHREQAASLGAIHFLEKPFPHEDFVDLVQALLSPSAAPDSEKFQGTLSDLHLADIIQLKCMSGSSAALQFTGPQGEKARVYFESGQVRHAIAPGKEGVAAFNEIVRWKGGQISEVSGAPQVPRTIDLDWQILLMEAVRKMDEKLDPGSDAPTSTTPSSDAKKILVIDDSLMLLSFVKEILTEANYRVVPVATAEEGLVSAATDVPDLILLDYILPDMKGDEVCKHLSQNSITAKIPIVYMSGFGADLKHDKLGTANVIGSLNKPFTSDLLLKTVDRYIPKAAGEQGRAMAASTAASEPVHDFTAPLESSWRAPEPIHTPEPVQVSTPAQPEPVSFESPWARPEPEAIVSEHVSSPESATTAPSAVIEDESVSAAVGAGDAWWSAPVTQPQPVQPVQPVEPVEPVQEQTSWMEPQPVATNWLPDAPIETHSPIARSEEFPPADGAFFSGDTSFFSLNGALQAIGKEKLTGTLRLFWNKEPVDLFARSGEIILVTTRDPQLYCPEAPVTLVNVAAEKTEQARERQRETGCPIFLTLAADQSILHEPAIQLVQHYGQKLFVQLWTAHRVRFVFQQSDALPEFCNGISGEADIDHWILSTLRCIQLQDLGSEGEIESGNIPAYTRDGYTRVQGLRLTVAEAQFASQFNGARSVAQIARNLRLDLKFARLTLFRFLALEIVECWPPMPAAKQEKKGFLKTIGFGD